MSSETKKNIGVMGLIALFLVNFGYMADLAIIPAADTIYSKFTDAPVWLLNFILTGPQLIGVFSALLMTVLMRHYSKRNTIIWLFALFTVVASLGAAIQNVWYVAAMRAVTGLAAGGLAPVAIALINELFHDDKAKCSMLIGSFSGVSALIGAAMTMVGGVLCTGGWTHVFYEYYAAVPMLILMIIFIPKTPPEKDTVQNAEAVAVETKFDPKRVAAILASLLILGVIFNIVSYECSMYVAENNLGTSVFSGALSAILTISTAVACFGFAACYGKLKRFIAPVMYFMLALGFLGSHFIMGQVWICVCYIILGLSWGMAMSYFYVYATVIVPPSKASTVLGMVAAVVGFGAFLCSYASTAIMTLFKISQLKDLFFLYAGVLGVGLILSIILAIRCKKLKLDEHSSANKNSEHGQSVLPH